MATLSLCVIAKNEALNLPILDNSIDGCFDEKILVDTGSTDGTVELAKALGWIVYHFEWAGVTWTLQAGDVVTLCGAGANTAIQSCNVTLALKALQDIKSSFGTSV